jgi:hypothetical protein
MRTLGSGYVSPTVSLRSMVESTLFTKVLDWEVENGLVTRTAAMKAIHRILKRAIITRLQHHLCNTLGSDPPA